MEGTPPPEGPRALAARRRTEGRSARNLVSWSVAVAGGDSSGGVMGTRGIRALEVAAGLSPGAPLCRASAEDPACDGLEFALKGGQMGGVDFFPILRAGIPGQGA